MSMSGLQTDVMSNTTQGLLYCLYAISAFFAYLEETRLQLGCCTPHAFLWRLASSFKAYLGRLTTLCYLNSKSTFQLIFRTFFIYPYVRHNGLEATVSERSVR